MSTHPDEQPDEDPTTANARWREAMIGAYTRFHELGWSRQETFPGLVSFTIADDASQADGSFQWSWSVPSAVRETINGINAWAMRLHEWATWIELLPEYDEETRWEITHHFVEPLAFFAMYQPSAVAERLLEVAETALHHANCFAIPNTKDRLEQDSLKPGARFSVRQRLTQLDRLCSHWNTYQRFRDLWSQIDSKTYRKLSRDFRNLSSHSFGPRFHTGEIRRARRSVGPPTVAVEQPDGSYRIAEDPTRTCVRYEFGVIEPLEFTAAYKANLDEFRHTKRCIDSLHHLVGELVEAMNTRHAELTTKDIGGPSTRKS
jgi:hypothetical protein